MKEMLKETTLESRSWLKKIIAARGELQGNFYFAGDTGAKESGLSVTLSSRDPDGEKVAAAGKKIRKEIAGAKFARGIVRMDGSKLIFELHQGSAKKDLLLKSFKSQLSELDGLGFLRKALVRKPPGEGEDPAPDGEGSDTSPDIDTSAFAREQEEESIGWLDVEKKAQGALDALNKTLQATFLSAEQAEADEGEQIAAVLGRIQALTAARPVDADALAAARNSLAATIYAGEDPFPGVGESVSSEVLQALKGSIEAAKKSHERFLRLTEAALRTLYVELQSRDDRSILAEKDEILSTVAAHRRAAATYMVQLESLLR